MRATPVEMAEAQDFPKSAFVVLLEDYRALERQLSEAKGTQIGWMVEGTYNGEEISRTLFALEDREFADLFKENNGGVVKPIYDAPTQMKRSLEPQASAEDRMMTEERKPNASLELCPNGLTPDGPICPRCGGHRGPSGVDGGSWVHCPPSSVRSETELTQDQRAAAAPMLVGEDSAHPSTSTQTAAHPLPTPRTPDSLLELYQDDTRWQLCQRISTAEAERNTLESENAELRGQLAEAERQRDEARRDAERYRWLRSKNTGPSMIEKVSDDCQPPYFTLKCEAELDAAIDAAKEVKPRQQVDSEHRICEHGRNAFADDCGMCDRAGTNYAAEVKP